VVEDRKLVQFRVTPNELTSARQWLLAPSAEEAIRLAGYTVETATAIPTSEIEHHERTWTNGG
jgi:hypothetical protein